MRTRRNIAVAAVAALAVTGCGGSSDADQAKSTVKSFLDDVASGKGAAACTKLTPQAQQALSHAIANMPCDRAIDALGAATSKSVRAKVSGINPQITVHGSSATATYASVTGSRATRILQLQKIGGSWKISSLPGS